MRAWPIISTRTRSSAGWLTCACAPPKGSYAEEYFNRKGELRAIPAKKLKFWPLPDLLEEKYDFLPASACAFAEFLLPMLAFSPEARATAAAVRIKIVCKSQSCMVSK